MSDDLLCLARSSRAGADPQIRTIEICDVVTRAVEAVIDLLRDRKHHLALSMAISGLEVDVDDDLVTAGLVNVLKNVARQTPAGGRLSISARRDAETVRVRVADNVAGIPPRVSGTEICIVVPAARAFDPVERCG